MFKYNQKVVKNRFRFLLFFVSSKTMHNLVLLRIISIGAPKYSRSNFGPIKVILEKSKMRDCFMVKLNQINMKNRFLFLRFHKTDTDW